MTYLSNLRNYLSEKYFWYMNKKTVILIAGIVILIIFFFINNKFDFDLSQIGLGQMGDSNSRKEEIPKDTDATANIQEYLDTRKWKTYQTKDFSFKYDERFKITNTLNNGNEITTAEDDKFGFQIFIMPFDEPGPITPERILQDVPDMEINDPKNADLDGVKTLVFNGYDEDMGETFEAWIVHKGKLYQIAGPKIARQIIIETLETWRWK